jgi:hypothetical protein
MSPEQARGQDLDGRSDLFSLGVVLYELATRTHPFPGTTPADVVAALLTSTPPAARTSHPDVPSGLDAVITRLLEKEPAGRYQTAAALQGELRRVQAAIAPGAAATSIPPVPEGTRDALGTLRTAVLGGASPWSVDADVRRLVQHHEPRSAQELHLKILAQPVDVDRPVDKRFTPLTLLVHDRNELGVPGWSEQPRHFDDLRQVIAMLDQRPEASRVVVVEGPPGSGKSTLLTRFEYDVALDAIRNSEEQWTLLVELNEQHSDPLDWLTRQWVERYCPADRPGLPAFDAVRKSGRLVLLLDALNEMPHVDAADTGVVCASGATPSRHWSMTPLKRAWSRRAAVRISARS